MATQPSDERAIARQTRALLKGAAAHLTGRQRGRDREVRRNSYDIEDPRAKPWVPIGKGTVGEGLAHREALIQTAREHRGQFWRENPPSKIREARYRRDLIVAELKRIEGGGAAPIGYAATLRIELKAHEETLAKAETALRRIDVTILQALIEHIDFATGRLFPSLETIAAAATCHRNSVIDALKRLKANGFVTWVRRSISTQNEGEFAPQREQTSNAYYFEHRQRMAIRTWQRFTQLLTAKLRRLGKVPREVRPLEPVGPPSKEVQALRDAVASLGASLSNASP